MNEFIRSDGYIIVNVPYAEAYIPESLFKPVDKESEITSAVAFEYGEGINVVGCFNMRFMESDTQNRDKVPVRTFNYPSPIETYPTSTLKNQKIRLTSADDENEINGDESDEVRYRVLQYYKGDIMMSATSTEAVANCEKFLNMMTSGKIPNTIPYSSLEKIWQANFDMNGVNPGTPSVSLQSVIAEQCRWVRDPRIPFRKVIGAGKGNENDYVMVNMRSVASYNSTFSALTFEDMGQMLISSINMSRNNVKQNKSPIEKVLGY